MSNGKSILKFEEVTFRHTAKKLILDEVDFVVRKGAKLTLMGQNGAGKSTLFKLVTGELEPEDGRVIRDHGMTIAVSRQVIPRDQLDFSVRDFFQAVFAETIYNIDPKIKEILDVVHLRVDDYDKTIRQFSGGQQARLLLASALIQKPDLLLLDEPTNNLDKGGIKHLTQFLQDYDKTVVVISHDAEFLNSFTQGVLYLDVFSKKVQQYVGNYYDVVEQIGIKIDRDRRKNARLKKLIQQKKDKANAFANKGGRLRMVAKKMREAAADAEDNMVDSQKEDKTIRPFTIPMQEDISGELVALEAFSRLRNEKVQKRKLDIPLVLRKGDRLLLEGPNGIGKSTLLERLATGKADGAHVKDGVKIGYYRQDFSTLDFDKTPYETLKETMTEHNEHKLRSSAAGFLITSDLMNQKIGDLSEGQKGLVAFAQLVLLKPGLLIMDEPTNHINFRHIPVIAEALDQFEGAMIVVSHVPEFVVDIGMNMRLNLDKGK